jgi:RNA polymerase sigma-70 factor, ECF subfamily
VTSEVRAAVDEAFREEWGQVVATLIRVTGDWDLAEECAQDAFALALERWRRDGVPGRAGAWLTTVARNRAIDRLRREAVGAAKLREAAALAPPEGPRDEAAAVSGVGDDRLRLMFTCCHPALSLEAQVALTLRTLAGLTTAEIARAFLVPEPTMSKRLLRAKQKIRHAGIPYRVPPAHLLPERTAGVLGVLYLLFNEGYSATAGADLVRQGLCDEAIRLARLLVRLLPGEPEAAGLLALMLLHDARRATRVDQAGELVTLEDQDRGRWDRAEIDEGVDLLERALRRRRPGPYQLQAAIAACHASAAAAADTDWAEIAALYGQLARLVPSPVVELNRAVAVAMAEGPAAGLALVEALEASGELVGYHLLPATRADLLRRLGRAGDAAAAYRQALALASTDAERRFLGRRLAETTAGRRPRRSPRDPVRSRPARSSVGRGTPVRFGNGGDPMKTVRSSDGTTIAFDRWGSGPPLLYVGGALNDRSAGAPLGGLLASRFSVLAYDRRGRGGSGDTAPYQVQREIEDLAALIAEAGGSAFVYGMSSGGVLALEAAAQGLPITRLAIYEPPFAADEGHARRAREYAAKLTAALSEGRRGEALELFMTLAGTPWEMIGRMRGSPMWPALEALAPSLAHDSAVMGDSRGAALPAERLAAVPVPTLVLDGGASPAWMREVARRVAGALPAGEHRTLEGQTHAVAPEVLALVLEEFFGKG